MKSYNVSLFCTNFGAGDAVIVTVDSENKITVVEYDYSYSTNLLWSLHATDFKVGADFDEELSNVVSHYEEIADKSLIVYVSKQEG